MENTSISRLLRWYLFAFSDLYWHHRSKIDVVEWMTLIICLWDDLVFCMCHALPISEMLLHMVFIVDWLYSGPPPPPPSSLPHNKNQWMIRVHFTNELMRQKHQVLALFAIPLFIWHSGEFRKGETWWITTPAIIYAEIIWQRKHCTVCIYTMSVIFFYSLFTTICFLFISIWVGRFHIHIARRTLPVYMPCIYLFHWNCFNSHRL